MARKVKKRQETIRIVFINTLARTAPTYPMPVLTTLQTAAPPVEHGEAVSLEVDGKKIEGKIVNMTDSNIFLVDTEGKLHIIPLEKLKKKGAVKVLAL